MSEPDTCPECNGRGHFLFAFSTPTCTHCGGTGKVASDSSRILVHPRMRQMPARLKAMSEGRVPVEVEDYPSGGPRHTFWVRGILVGVWIYPDACQAYFERRGRRWRLGPFPHYRAAYEAAHRIVGCTPSRGEG